jgi:hypothetical protein
VTRADHTSSEEGTWPQLASTRPDLGLLFLHVSPAHEPSFQKFALVGFREELLHGSRRTFGLTRNARLFLRDCYATLLSAVTGDTDVATAKQTVRETGAMFERIREHQRPLIETVDQFLTTATLRDETLLQQQTARMFDSPTERAQFLENVPTEPDPARREEILPSVLDALEDIRATFRLDTAVAVADAALDVPFFIAEPPSGWGVDANNAHVVPLTEVDLEERFSGVRNTFEALNPDRKAAPGRALAETLRREFDGVIPPEDSVQQVSLPLLDIPERTAVDENEGPGVSRFETTPSVLSQLVRDAFGPQGQFGGLVYYTASGERQWLNNPLFEGETVPARFDVGRGVERSYREYWQLNVVLDRLFLDLFNDDDCILQCQICEYTNGHQCGGDSCLYDPLVAAFQKFQPKFNSVSVR